MKGYMKREDDYLTRHKHLENLSSEELKERFWQLAEEAVTPLLELARTHTSPSVERSVLLRMGFSSIEAKPLVDACIDRNLISKGAGHVVYRTSKLKNIPIRQAGLELIEGKHWEDVIASFRGGQAND